MPIGLFCVCLLLLPLGTFAQSKGGSVLASGGTPDLSLVFSPRILLPLLGLAALSLAPVAWRHWKGRHA